MSPVKQFTCIVCPRGCLLTVEITEPAADAVSGAPNYLDAVRVVGAARGRGVVYGRQQATAPLRSLTTTLRTSGADRPRLPVRSSADLPLERLLDACIALDTVVAQAPLRCGDVVMADLLGLGIDMLASDDLAVCPANGASHG